MLFLPFYRFTSAAAAVVAGEAMQPSGGHHPWLRPYRTRGQRRHIWGSGFPEEVAQLIQAVAERQLDDLDLEEGARFAQLEGEIQRRELKWQEKYLAALEVERGLLIDLEIERRLKAKLEDEMILLLLIAAAQ